MQRLFVAFPSGKPGLALLLLRVGLSVLLLDGVVDPLAEMGAHWIMIAPWVVAAGLCLGCITPIMAALCVLVVVGTWLSGTAPLRAVHFCAILDATALILLGPGAYAVDAVLFGRKRIVFPPSDHSEDE